MKIGISRGFTIIEMIIVILVSAILASIAIPEFIDYRLEAKNAKTQQFLGAMRSGIANQYSQQVLRCEGKSGEWPKVESITANDVTIGSGAYCTTAEVPVPAERKFISANEIPSNPWGPPGSAANFITACVGTGCVRCNAAGCNNSAESGGWCFNESSGDFWADSSNNGGVPGAEECNF